ncbi:MAG: histidine kinase [Solirubrobacterales bacterium]
MRGLRRALLGLGVAGFLFGLLVAAVIAGTDHEDHRLLFGFVELSVGWSFVGTGLFAWYRRPDNSAGPLMTGVGFFWLVQGLAASNSPGVFAFGQLFGTLSYGLLVHLLLSFPDGRLETRLQRAVVGLTYLIVTVGVWVPSLFVDTAHYSRCENCPPNPILLHPDNGFYDAWGAGMRVISLVAIALMLVAVWRRWRGWSDAERRSFAPLLWAGAFVLLLQACVFAANLAGAGDTVRSALFLLSLLPLIAVPFCFLYGLLRARLDSAAALSAENERLDAELRAKVEELRNSRARIVEAGYEQRRRLERDLHDGAQQRLMALGITLRMARSKLDDDSGEVAGLLDEAVAELGATASELRELARGIHPAVLTDRGLGAAVEGLAGRSPVPVEVVESPVERLPAPVESAGYFVVAEALTNVARYSGASRAEVRIARRNGGVEVEVSDDGVGGARAGEGSGLSGLADRVEALDGTFEVDSPPGGGTRIVARIPCG